MTKHLLLSHAMRASLPWLALLLVLFALRVAAGWPDGVDRDENQNCWNARCLSEGGTDFRGVEYPLILEDYGDDKHAIYAWALAGLDRLGISATPAVGRWFSAFLIMVGALCVGLALRLQTGSDAWGLIAMGVLGALPWYQVGTCLSWEVSTSPPGYCVMWLGLALVAYAGRQVLGVALFLLGFGYAVYGYPPPKLLAPALLAAACLLFWKTWRARITVGALGCLLVLPLLLEHLKDSSQTDRAATIFVDDFGTFWSNWLSHYGPSFLFLNGDPNPRHFAGFLGVVPIALGVALVWRLVRAILARRFWPGQALDRYAVVCLALFALPAALTQDGNSHVDRSLLGGVAFAWLALGGITAMRSTLRWAVAPLLVLTALQCLGNFGWIRFVWRDAETTQKAFHGRLYAELRDLRALEPARVFFSPLPEPIASAFPYIHFGWTALDSRPVPGRIDEVVTRLSGGVPHLATRGTPLVDVWQGQPAGSGRDLLIQAASVPAPAGFTKKAGLSPPLQLYVRERAQ